MRRLLLPTSVFARAARRLVKKNPGLAESLQQTLDSLAADAFQPGLKSHKLKGDLAGTWACSVGYDLRIVFELVDHDGTEAIRLLTIGTHDEVH